MNIEIIKILVNTLGVGVVSAAILVSAYYVRRYNLSTWITRAVHAAELLFDAPDSQAAKKEWVLTFIKSNVKCSFITEEMLNVLIEAAVEALNVAQKDSSASTPSK